jgi:hypothetical protein
VGLTLSKTVGLYETERLDSNERYRILNLFDLHRPGWHGRKHDVDGSDVLFWAGND